MTQDKLMAVLDRARWAPSGDNEQPWRFEILGPQSLAVHGFDTRDDVIYDFRGQASHIAHGALLESIKIAASVFAWRMEWELREASDERHPVYELRFLDDANIRPDPLEPYLDTRVVQRRPMKTRPLTAEQRAALKEAVGTNYDVRFFEPFEERLKVAKLLWRNAGVRLRCPEAYPVHKKVIDWGQRFSKDRIPEQAVGVDPATATLMKWVMQDWERVRFFNRYLFGTIAPRIQLDFVPALCCAAHVLISAKRAPKTTVDWVEAGSAMQRMWLTVASLGLFLQPEMTPLIFSWYAKAGVPASKDAEINTEITALASAVENHLIPAGNEGVFFCRIGASKAPVSRSLRLDLEKLVAAEPPATP